MEWEVHPKGGDRPWQVLILYSPCPLRRYTAFSLPPLLLPLPLSTLHETDITLISHSCCSLPPFRISISIIQKPKRNEGLVFSDRYYVILLYTICSSEYLHRILIWYSKLSTAPAGVDVGHSGWRWQWRRRHAREQ
jgi:hypothetical protein